MKLRIAIYILYFLLLVFGTIGIIISINILLDPSIQKNVWGIIKYDSTEREILSKIGEYFGGFIGTIFGITSTLLIVVSLIKGNIDSHKTNLINVYFKMLEFHHSNVTSLSISGIYKSSQKINGRRAFVTFTSQLYKIYGEVISIHNSLEHKLSIGQLSIGQMISITFSAFYHGIDKESESRLKLKIRLACPLLNEDKINTIFSILKNKKDELKEGLTKKDEINDYHSGVSHAFVMRTMEYIAKNGYDFFKTWLNNESVEYFYYKLLLEYSKKLMYNINLRQGAQLITSYEKYNEINK